MYQWRGIEKEVGEVLTGSNIKIIDIKDKQDDKVVLKNPHKGLYHHYYDNSIEYYLCQDDDELIKVEGLNYLLVRVDWANLEPEEGVYNWKLIDDLVERFYKPYGLGLSFSIACKETHDELIFATPEWVKNAGAKGTFERPILIQDNGEVMKIGNGLNWTPDYSDQIYLEKLEAFHMAFAKRYQDELFVEEIIVASVGDWGEGHSSFSGNRLETIETLKKHIDMYARCYPKNQKSVGDDFIRFNLKSSGTEMELLNYCIEKGFGMRDDSINVSYYVKEHPESYSVASPEFFPIVAPRYPTNLEMEHYQYQRDQGNWIGKNGSIAGADVLRGAIDVMMPSYVSFHGYARDWYDENKDIADEVANKCGYWYFLDCVSVSETILSGCETQIGFKWVNKGVARAYNKFKLLIKIEGIGEDTTSYILEAKNSDNESWLAYQSTNEIVCITIPKVKKQSEYKLKIKLTYTNKCNDTVEVKLAFESTIIDQEGFYEIGNILVK